MEIPTLAAFGLYGPVGGLIVVWVGSMVTASISYMLGRVIGPPVLKRWAEQPRVQAITRAVGDLNPLALILLRWISFIPYDVLNMIFGACQVPVFRFAWTTAVGVLVTNIVTALLYRTALHAHWGELLLMVALVFVLGWGLYWWSNRTHLRSLNTRDDMDL
nr:VTT domain-containing protein [Sulfobacillus harzensis]